MLKMKLEWWSAVAALGLMVACGSEETAPVDDDDQTSEGSPSTDSDDDDDPTPPKRDAGGNRSDAGTGGKRDGSTGGGGNTGDASSGGGAKGDAGSGNTGGGAGGAIPCEVSTIVEKHCGTCHGDEPVSADFSLTKLEHFTGPAQTDTSKKMHAEAYARVTSTDAKKKMPPTGKGLSTDELKTLGDWLKGGAKAGAACEGTGGEQPADDAGAGEPTSKGGSGGAHAKPITYDDPMMTCHKLTAFGKSDRKAKYMVPTTPDYYVAFNVKAPWTGKQYIRSMRTVIDNGPVLHHWLIFKQPTGGAETVTENALGAHPEGQMLYGWAPGGDDMFFDPDVGMEVDSSVLYQLEMHYNNKTGGPVPDASGVEICVTPTKPKHVAGLTWVGTDNINGTQAVGRCAHTSQEPIHVIAAQPHMHVKGKHMKVTLARKGGMMETLHDQAFDFDYQKSYILDTVLQPGDVMNTTCTYSSPARFGKATTAEMCYFFTIAWPAGALKSLGLGTIIHGENSCIDL
jgi:cytochrome c553